MSHACNNNYYNSLTIKVFYYSIKSFLTDISIALTWQYQCKMDLNRGVGTSPADPATVRAGPKFPVHQESPQFSNINCNQATLKFTLQLHVYTKAIALLYIIDYYIKNTRC